MIVFALVSAKGGLGFAGAPPQSDTSLIAAPPPTRFNKEDSATQVYIEQFKDLAMAEMRRTGIPAAIKIAQGIVETQSGTSALVLASRNHFGLKCKRDWAGERVFHDDDAKDDCFRKYPSDSISYLDQSNYLRKSSRYRSLFTQIDPLDYKKWAHGLQKAGYATNPAYASMLVRKIENWGLQRYSLEALHSEGKISTRQYVKMLANVPFRKQSTAKDIELAKRTITTSNQNLLAYEYKPNIGRGVVVSYTVENEYNLIHGANTQKSAGLARKTMDLQAYLKKQPLKSINRRKAVFVPSGTSLLAISLFYKVPYTLLLSYNDFSSDANITLKDQYVFIHQKRNRGAQQFCLVSEQQSLYDISQLYGVHLGKLRKYNYLSPGMEPRTNEKIYLQGMAPARPAIY